MNRQSSKRTWKMHQMSLLASSLLLSLHQNPSKHNPLLSWSSQAFPFMLSQISLLSPLSSVKTLSVPSWKIPLPPFLALQENLAIPLCPSPSQKYLLPLSQTPLLSKNTLLHNGLQDIPCNVSLSGCLPETTSIFSNSQPRGDTWILKSPPPAKKWAAQTRTKRGSTHTFNVFKFLTLHYCSYF